MKAEESSRVQKDKRPKLIKYKCKGLYRLVDVSDIVNMKGVSAIISDVCYPNPVICGIGVVKEIEDSGSDADITVKPVKDIDAAVRNKIEERVRTEVSDYHKKVLSWCDL